MSELNDWGSRGASRRVSQDAYIGEIDSRQLSHSASRPRTDIITEQPHLTTKPMFVTITELARGFFIGWCRILNYS